MDGHGSHLTLEFIEFALKHNIMLYGFPPHSTHLIQPLDAHPFQALKHYFRVNNNSHLETEDKAFFLDQIGKLREQAFTPRCIRHAFKQRGIFPFNPAIVMQPLLDAVPLVPDLQIFGETPPPETRPPSSDITTPETIRTAKRYVDKATRLITTEMTPEHASGVLKLLHHGLQSFEFSTTLQDEFRRLNDRPNPAKRSRRQVKGISGGNATYRIDVGHAKRQIGARKAADMKRQERRLQKQRVSQGHNPPQNRDRNEAASEDGIVDE